ncbi:MAG: hypothetical protein WCA16_17265 [Candidatus Sulfotelmatobacter sp.]
MAGSVGAVGWDSGLRRSEGWVAAWQQERELKLQEEPRIVATVEKDSGTERPPLRVRWAISIVLGGLTVSFFILMFGPAPFVWIWLTWAAVFFCGIACVHRSWPRAILLNLGIVACLLAGAEGYLIKHEYVPPVYPDGDLYVHDNILGWAPKKGTIVHAIKPLPAGLFHGPQGMLFDVKYSIDSDGLRAAPPYRKDQSAGSILFFGCSFTFGEGLKDDETLPYQVGMQSQGRYRTFNFGVGGYGPEQMLAAIERGMVTRLVDTPPRYAYYVALPGHVWRVAGKVTWGGQAPRYVLGTDGTVHLAGNLKDRPSLAARMGITRGVRQLNKSAIWRMLSMRDSHISDDDLRLYFAVVRRSKDLLTAQYPGIQFRVILWVNQADPEDRPVYEKMQNGFRQMGIPVGLVEEILPGYGTDQLKYVLSSADHHPNALANLLLAQHILYDVEK